jgi:hypothetical protein
LKDIVEVHVPAPNQSHLALQAISNKAGGFSKFLKHGDKVVYIILIRAQKNDGVISKERCTDDRSSSKNGVKLSLLGGFSKNVVEWVYFQDKEERR